MPCHDLAPQGTSFDLDRKRLRAAVQVTVAAACVALTASCSEEATGAKVLGQGDGISSIAADGTDVFWTDFPRGTVSRVSRSGGPSEVIARVGASDPLDIAVDSTHVYWVGANSATVSRVAKAGGSPEVLATENAIPWGRLALDAGAVYWLTYTGGGGAVYTVERVPKGGGAAQRLHAGTGFPQDLAADDTDVYATVIDDSATQAGRIIRLPKEGGTPVTLASAQICPWALAVNATHVFWTNGGGQCTVGGAEGAVMRVAKSGGSPEPVATGQVLPSGIALDATHAYWTNLGNTASGGSVMRAPLALGPVELIAKGHYPMEIAVDDSAIYWSTFDQISSLAKPRNSVR